MLEIVLTPEILEPPKSGAPGLSLFSLMVNPRLHACIGYATKAEKLGKVMMRRVVNEYGKQDP